MKAKKLVFRLSEDEDAVSADFLAGELDLIAMFGPDTARAAEEAGVGSLEYAQEMGTYYICFNSRGSVFDGMDDCQAACLREAVSLLIDRKAICEALGISEEAAADSLIPDTMSDGAGGKFESSFFDAFAISNDREKTLARARQLLIAAGLEFGADGKLGKHVSISFAYNDGGAHATVAGIVAAGLSELGISLDGTAMPWGDFLSVRSEGGYDSYRGGWICDFNDPINMLELFTTYSGEHICGFGK